MKVYKFTGSVGEQVEGFKSYLQKLGNQGNTIRQKSNYAGSFLKWLETERLLPEDARYNDILDFIDYCKLEDDGDKLINRKIQSIRSFYGYLQSTNQDILNPASNLHLRGIRRKAVTGVIDYKTLETIYQSFETNGNRGKRNKIILGLLICQAVNTEELSKLEPCHVKLKEGKIYIPGNRRRNSRTLELKSFQVMELHEYITETRPKILEEITKPKPCRKPDRINKARIKDQLFVSINGSEHVKNSLLHLFRGVQKVNPNITNAQQIRQCTITYWLKTMNLRQVQYMAGHKYVSSTERYQLGNLDKLQEKLEKLHPLENRAMFNL